MTQYASSPGVSPAYAKQVQEAKAASDAAKVKRQAVLARVGKQRATAYTQKRTAQEWVQEGYIIRASELKEQYQNGKRSPTGASGYRT